MSYNYVRAWLFKTDWSEKQPPFFLFKIMLVIELSFSLFYLSYLSLKMWELLLKYECIKKDRKTIYLIHDKIKTLWPLLSQCYIATTRRKFAFLPFSSQYFQVLNCSTSEQWKVELTLQWPSGFESNPWNGNPVPYSLSHSSMKWRPSKN